MFVNNEEHIYPPELLKAYPRGTLGLAPAMIHHHSSHRRTARVISLASWLFCFVLLCSAVFCCVLLCSAVLRAVLCAAMFY